MTHFNLKSVSVSKITLHKCVGIIKTQVVFEEYEETWKIYLNSDLKLFVNSQPSALNFKGFPPSLEYLFLTQGQNNLGNKILFFLLMY